MSTGDDIEEVMISIMSRTQVGTVGLENGGRFIDHWDN